MRELTRCEVAAMWLYGREYSAQPLSAIDYWRKISDTSKGDRVREMVSAILKATRDER